MEALDASEGRGSLLSFMSPKPISKALPAGNVLEISMKDLSGFSAFGLYLVPGFLFLYPGVESVEWRGAHVGAGWVLGGGLEASFLPFCWFFRVSGGADPTGVGV